MGSICNKTINSPYKEFDLEEIIFGRTYIYGPPCIEKPQPIPILCFSDDDINFQKEEEQQHSSQKFLLQEEELLQLSERDLKQADVKLSVDDVLILKEKPELREQSSISKEDPNSDLRDSNLDITKHKSILKRRSQNNSNPQSPKNQLKDSLTTGSQKSIKKVTFDKKSKVVYSSFRKIQH
ncbi:unnamed protein product [Paramecium sonneborni]|uniref:Uncharacterized protein n=1 Tax=Paramecium sonneborni TaxID=65129 RepID=A0A8S1L779_9CILI|nr:unnamed protein product [Paramecium sonneborni]